MKHRVDKDTEIVIDGNVTINNYYHERPCNKPRIAWSIHYLGATFNFDSTGDNIMSFQLPDDRSATLAINPQDAAGFAAKVENVVWASSDPTVADVVVADDGLSAQLAPATPPKLGTAQISVTADALIGDGVQNITGLLDVEVVSGQAVSLTVGATLNPVPTPVV